MLEKKTSIANFGPVDLGPGQDGPSTSSAPSSSSPISDDSDEDQPPTTPDLPPIEVQPQTMDELRKLLKKEIDTPERAKEVKSIFWKFIEDNGMGTTRDRRRIATKVLKDCVRRDLIKFFMETKKEEDLSKFFEDGLQKKEAEQEKSAESERLKTVLIPIPAEHSQWQNPPAHTYRERLENARKHPYKPRELWLHNVAINTLAYAFCHDRQQGFKYRAIYGEWILRETGFRVADINKIRDLVVEIFDWGDGAQEVVSQLFQTLLQTHNPFQPLLTPPIFPQNLPLPTQHLALFAGLIHAFKFQPLIDQLRIAAPQNNPPNFLANPVWPIPTASDAGVADPSPQGPTFVPPGAVKESQSAQRLSPDFMANLLNFRKFCEGATTGTAPAVEPAEPVDPVDAAEPTESDDDVDSSETEREKAEETKVSNVDENMQEEELMDEDAASIKTTTPARKTTGTPGKKRTSSSSIIDQEEFAEYDSVEATEKLFRELMAQELIARAQGPQNPSGRGSRSEKMKKFREETASFKMAYNSLKTHIFPKETKKKQKTSADANVPKTRRPPREATKNVKYADHTKQEVNHIPRIDKLVFKGRKRNTLDDASQPSSSEAVGADGSETKTPAKRGRKKKNQDPVVVNVSTEEDSKPDASEATPSISSPTDSPGEVVEAATLSKEPEDPKIVDVFMDPDSAPELDYSTPNEPMISEDLTSEPATSTSIPTDSPAPDVVAEAVKLPETPENSKVPDVIRDSEKKEKSEESVAVDVGNDSPKDQKMQESDKSMNLVTLEAIPSTVKSPEKPDEQIVVDTVPDSRQITSDENFEVPSTLENATPETAQLTSSLMEAPAADFTQAVKVPEKSEGSLVTDCDKDSTQEPNDVEVGDVKVSRKPEDSIVSEAVSDPVQKPEENDFDEPIFMDLVNEEQSNEPMLIVVASEAVAVTSTPNEAPDFDGMAEKLMEAVVEAVVEVVEAVKVPEERATTPNSEETILQESTPFENVLRVPEIDPAVKSVLVRILDSVVLLEETVKINEADPRQQEVSEMLDEMELEPIVQDVVSSEVTRDDPMSLESMDQSLVGAETEVFMERLTQADTEVSGAVITVLESVPEKNPATGIPVEAMVVTIGDDQCSPIHQKQSSAVVESEVPMKQPAREEKIPEVTEVTLCSMNNDLKTVDQTSPIDSEIDSKKDCPAETSETTPLEPMDQNHSTSVVVESEVSMEKPVRVDVAEVIIPVKNSETVFEKIPEPTEVEESSQSASLSPVEVMEDVTMTDDQSFPMDQAESTTAVVVSEVSIKQPNQAEEVDVTISAKISEVVSEKITEVTDIIMSSATTNLKTVENNGSTTFIDSDTDSKKTSSTESSKAFSLEPMDQNQLASVVMESEVSQKQWNQEEVVTPRKSSSTVTEKISESIEVEESTQSSSVAPAKPMEADSTTVDRTIDDVVPEVSMKQPDPADGVGITGPVKNSEKILDVREPMDQDQSTTAVVVSEVSIKQPNQAEEVDVTISAMISEVVSEKITEVTENILSPVETDSKKVEPSFPISIIDRDAESNKTSADDTSEASPLETMDQDQSVGAVVEFEMFMKKSTQNEDARTHFEKKSVSEKTPELTNDLKTIHQSSPIDSETVSKKTCPAEASETTPLEPMDQDQSISAVVESDVLMEKLAHVDVAEVIIPMKISGTVFEKIPESIEVEESSQSSSGAPVVTMDSMTADESGSITMPSQTEVSETSKAVPMDSKVPLKQPVRAEDSDVSKNLQTAPEKKAKSHEVNITPVELPFEPMDEHPPTSAVGSETTTRAESAKVSGEPLQVIEEIMPEENVQESTVLEEPTQILPPAKDSKPSKPDTDNITNQMSPGVENRDPMVPTTSSAISDSVVLTDHRTEVVTSEAVKKTPKLKVDSIPIPQSWMPLTPSTQVAHSETVGHRESLQAEAMARKTLSFAPREASSSPGSSIKPAATTAPKPPRRSANDFNSILAELGKAVDFHAPDLEGHEEEQETMDPAVIREHPSPILVEDSLQKTTLKWTVATSKDVVVRQKLVALEHIPKKKKTVESSRAIVQDAEVQEAESEAGADAPEVHQFITDAPEAPEPMEVVPEAPNHNVNAQEAQQPVAEAPQLTPAASTTPETSPQPAADAFLHETTSRCRPFLFTRCNSVQDGSTIYTYMMSQQNPILQAPNHVAAIVAPTPAPASANHASTAAPTAVSASDQGPPASVVSALNQISVAPAPENSAAAPDSNPAAVIPAPARMAPPPMSSDPVVPKPARVSLAQMNPAQAPTTHPTSSSVSQAPVVAPVLAHVAQSSMAPAPPPMTSAPVVVPPARVAPTPSSRNPALASVAPMPALVSRAPMKPAQAPMAHLTSSSVSQAPVAAPVLAHVAEHSMIPAPPPMSSARVAPAPSSRNPDLTPMAHMALSSVDPVPTPMTPALAAPPPPAFASMTQASMVPALTSAPMAPVSQVLARVPPVYVAPAQFPMAPAPGVLMTQAHMAHAPLLPMNPTQAPPPNYMIPGNPQTTNRTMCTFAAPVPPPAPGAPMVQAPPPNHVLPGNVSAPGNTPEIHPDYLSTFDFPAIENFIRYVNAAHGASLPQPTTSAPEIPLAASFPPPTNSSVPFFPSLRTNRHPMSTDPSCSTSPWVVTETPMSLVTPPVSVSMAPPPIAAPPPPAPTTILQRTPAEMMGVIEAERFVAQHLYRPQPPAPNGTEETQRILQETVAEMQRKANMGAPQSSSQTNWIPTSSPSIVNLSVPWNRMPPSYDVPTCKPPGFMTPGFGQNPLANVPIPIPSTSSTSNAPLPNWYVEYQSRKIAEQQLSRIPPITRDVDPPPPRKRASAQQASTQGPKPKTPRKPKAQPVVPAQAPVESLLVPAPESFNETRPRMRYIQRVDTNHEMPELARIHSSSSTSSNSSMPQLEEEEPSVSRKRRQDPPTWEDSIKRICFGVPESPMDYRKIREIYIHGNLARATPRLIPEFQIPLSMNPIPNLEQFEKYVRASNGYGETFRCWVPCPTAWFNDDWIEALKKRGEEQARFASVKEFRRTLVNVMNAAKFEMDMERKLLNLMNTHKIVRQDPRLGEFFLAHMKTIEKFKFPTKESERSEANLVVRALNHLALLNFPETRTSIPQVIAFLLFNIHNQVGVVYPVKGFVTIHAVIKEHLYGRTSNSTGDVIVLD